MSELFDVESHTITYHLKEIYQSGEFETYRKVQDENYISDFDREIMRLQGKKRKVC